MITFITGVAGSGKSYLAVYNIYNMYKKEDDVKLSKFSNIIYSNLKKYVKPKPKKIYSFCYTNINEFNFNFHKSLRPFNFNDFLPKITFLHTMYKAQKSDSEIIEKAKDLEVYDAVFYLDEVQNFLRKSHDVILWWFTYHRHLHQDIFLITQHLKQVLKEYLLNGEKFYKAATSSYRVFSDKMRYNLFSCPEMYQTCKESAGGINIPMINDVFQLYISGKNEKSQNQLHKILYFIIFLLLVLFFGSFIFIDSFSNDSKSQPELTDTKKIDINSTKLKKTQDENLSLDPPYSPEHEQEINVTNEYSQTNLENKKYLTFRCLDDICYIENNKFSYDFLMDFFSQNNITPFEKFTFKKIITVSALVDLNLYTVLVGGQNENVSKNGTSDSVVSKLAKF